MARNTGQRARFRSELTAVHANTLQNRADMEALMEVTQDTVEDVMKVVLADLKLTMELTEARLEALRWERDHIEHRVSMLGVEEPYHFECNAHIYWQSLPWWKRMINFHMRPSHVCR